MLHAKFQDHRTSGSGEDFLRQKRKIIFHQRMCQTRGSIAGLLLAKQTCYQPHYCAWFRCSSEERLLFYQETEDNQLHDSMGKVSGKGQCGFSSFQTYKMIIWKAQGVPQ